jgi:Fic family protein
VKWYQDIVSDIYRFQAENSALLDRLTHKKEDLDRKRPLPYSALHSIRETLIAEWSYHSNAIEGNTLTLNETQVVIRDGITVKGKSLREHLEAVNHHEAIGLVERLAGSSGPITLSNVLDIHRIVLLVIERDYAGRFRNGSVRINGANFLPPNALKVPVMMEEWENFVNHSAPSLHPAIAVAVLHHRFVWIHPFFDGNGRTARLVMNLYLMRLGFPPAIILKQDRQKYFNALQQTNNGRFGKLILLVAQAIERSLDIYLMAYPNGDDFRPIQNVLNEAEIPYGQEYISLLARQGKIAAFKEGNTWYTSAASVQDYLNKRKRKRVRN